MAAFCWESKVNDPPFEDVEDFGKESGAWVIWSGNGSDFVGNAELVGNSARFIMIFVVVSR